MSSRAGCGSGSRSCARCWRASRCWRWMSRSPRSTRSPAPRCRAGSRGVLAEEQRTVVLVTHDVEEAVLLGDRVLVLSPRPGRVVADLRSPARRPRTRTDPAVVDAAGAGARRARGRRHEAAWLLPLLALAGGCSASGSSTWTPAASARWCFPPRTRCCGAHRRPWHALAQPQAARLPRSSAGS